MKYLIYRRQRLYRQTPVPLTNSPTGNLEAVAVGSIGGETDWAAALRGVCVYSVHIAARVHVMKDDAADPLAEFLKTNMQGTANLAYQAAAAGVNGSSMSARSR